VPFVRRISRTGLLISTFYVGDSNSHLIRLKPELHSIKTKFSGKNFAFFNTESVFDSNLFASWNKPDSLRNREFGIGFGGSNKMNCRLWIDQNISECYINYRDSTYFDGCLLYSLDKLLKKGKSPIFSLKSNLRQNTSNNNLDNFSPSKESKPNLQTSTRQAPKSKQDIDAFESKIAMEDFSIDATGIEAWALMTPDKFSQFNAKLVQMSTFNHYDKMIGINYDSGTKDAEVVMSGGGHFGHSNRNNNQLN
jgi:hypothetical protein